MNKETIKVVENQKQLIYITSFIGGLDELSRMKMLKKEHNNNLYLLDNRGVAVCEVDEVFITIATGILHGLYRELRIDGFGEDARRFIENKTGVEQVLFQAEMFPDLPPNLLRSNFAEKTANSLLEI